MKINGKLIFRWAKDLFPMHRSITGKGTDKTLSYLKKIIGRLKIVKVRSGTKIFDWKIPQVWEINDAYIKNEEGKKIIDYKNCNLHVIGYSQPIKRKINFRELNKNLYTIPSQKKAIPFITSYYKKKWGFCISEEQKAQFKKKTKI